MDIPYSCFHLKLKKKRKKKEKEKITIIEVFWLQL